MRADVADLDSRGWTVPSSDGTCRRYECMWDWVLFSTQGQRILSRKSSRVWEKVGKASYRPLRHLFWITLSSVVTASYQAFMPVIHGWRFVVRSVESGR
jgi:hypothetical protein